LPAVRWLRHASPPGFRPAAPGSLALALAAQPESPLWTQRRSKFGRLGRLGRVSRVLEKALVGQRPVSPLCRCSVPTKNRPNRPYKTKGSTAPPGLWRTREQRRTAAAPPLPARPPSLRGQGERQRAWGCGIRAVIRTGGVLSKQLVLGGTKGRASSLSMRGARPHFVVGRPCRFRARPFLEVPDPRSGHEEAPLEAHDDTSGKFS
jgi:hypothetical protein